MTEVTSGIRSVLSRPVVYEVWSRLVGGEHGRSTLIREYARPRPADRILDLGCGPGELLAYLPGGVSYLGVDISPDYIARAREQYGTRAEFRVGDATAFDPGDDRFDLVLAFGVLHHLDDDQTGGLLRAAARAVDPGGRVVTVDPVHAQGQSRAARAIISRDRGQHVRTGEGYAALAREVYPTVNSVVRHDLLRIPYSHCILQCASGAASA
jgi:SAM-dependent methyltransferase